MTPSAMMTPPRRPKLLVAGLGGGLDVVNAALLFFAARAAGHDVTLGAIRPAPLATLRGHQPFSDSGACIDGATTITARGRYAEPRVAELLGAPLLFFSRGEEAEDRGARIGRLREALVTAKRTPTSISEPPSRVMKPGRWRKRKNERP